MHENGALQRDDHGLVRLRPRVCRRPPDGSGDVDWPVWLFAAGRANRCAGPSLFPEVRSSEVDEADGCARQVSGPGRAEADHGGA